VGRYYSLAVLVGWGISPAFCPCQKHPSRPAALVDGVPPPPRLALRLPTDRRRQLHPAEASQAEVAALEILVVEKELTPQRVTAQRQLSPHLLSQTSPSGVEQPWTAALRT